MTYTTIILSLSAFFALFTDPRSSKAAEDFFLGKASYYSHRFEGRRTAFGEIFRNESFTAAHRTLSHNTLLEVINLKNGQSVVVRVNDRGPWAKRCLIDISQAAAKKLGIIRSGIGDVSVRVVGSEGKLFDHEKECLSDIYPSGEQGF